VDQLQTRKAATRRSFIAEQVPAPDFIPPGLILLDGHIARRNALEEGVNFVL
jgi:hypothetical protein